MTFVNMPSFELAEARCPESDQPEKTRPLSQKPLISVPNVDYQTIEIEFGRFGADFLVLDAVHSASRSSLTNYSMTSRPCILLRRY